MSDEDYCAEIEKIMISSLKTDFEIFVRQNQQIHEITRKYLKFIEHRDNTLKKIELQNNILNLYNQNQQTYQNKLVYNDVRKDIVEILHDLGNLHEDLNFFHNKLLNMNPNFEIYKKVEDYKNDIRRFEIRLKELENN